MRAAGAETNIRECESAADGITSKMGKLSNLRGADA